MRRAAGFAILLALFTFPGVAWPQAAKEQPGTGSGDRSGTKLPVPGYNIPMDLGAWKKTLAITKITYNKDENELVFLVKARKSFDFRDDGYDHPFEFLDEDGVSLTTEKNLKWDKEPKALRLGELTRAHLELPDEDVLKMTKKARAVVKGFFNK